MKHTPGPWFVGQPSGSGTPDSCKQSDGKPYREHSSVLTKIGEHEKLVAHVYQGTGGVGSEAALDEQSANANLIAAAPDLLAALDELLMHHELDRMRTSPTMACHTPLSRKAIENARLAIAKATGGPQ